VTFRCVVGVGVVPFTAVELLVEAVEFGLVMFEFPSETFAVEVTLAVVGAVVFRFGVGAVVLISDVTLFTAAAVVFTELSVTFAAAGDCVVLETAVSLEELALPFIQTSDKLPALAISQCFVRFNVVPLQTRSWFVLLLEQTSVKFTWIAVELTCEVVFRLASTLDVQFEDVSLQDAVVLAAVVFCSEELALLDAVLLDKVIPVPISKGAAFPCEIQTGDTKTVIATNIVIT